MWHSVGKLSDFPSGTSQEIVVGCHVIAVFNTESGMYAVDGMCAHQGGPLANGKVAGCVITCPWHGWQYDLQTGQHLTAKSVRLQSFAVKIENGEVLIEVVDG
jgi:nitrite reductase (NADH) small subunit